MSVNHDNHKTKKAPAKHNAASQAPPSTNWVVVALVIVMDAIGGVWSLLGGTIIVLGLGYLLLHSLSPWLASTVFDHFKSSVGNTLGPIFRWLVIAVDIILGLLVTGIGLIEIVPVILAAGLLAIAFGLYTFFFGPSVIASILLPIVAIAGTAFAAKLHAPLLKKRLLAKNKQFDLDTTLELFKNDFKKATSGKASGELRDYLTVTAVVIIILTITMYAVVPHRSTQAFCNTFQKQATALNTKYSKQAANIEAQSNPLTGLLEATGSLIQAQGDMITLFNQLDKVAPGSIEPDIAAIRDMYKQQASETSKAVTDPLGTLASSLVSSLQNMGSTQRVDDYIKNNCNLSFMNQTTVGQNNSTAMAQAPKNNTAAKPNKDSQKLWDSGQHGILAFEGGATTPTSLVLLNPDSGSVIAQEAIPSSGKLGKASYNIAAESGGGSATYYFSATYRYMAVQFDKASDGSQDVGYYDLETNKAYDIFPNGGSGAQTVVVDTAPSFDPLNPNFLLFTRSTAGTGFSQGTSSSGQTYSYDLATKQIQPFPDTVLNGGSTCPAVTTLTTQTFSTQNEGCELAGQGSSAGMGLFNDHFGLTIDVSPSSPYGDGDGTNTHVEALQNGQVSNIDCDPVQWLNAKDILCTNQANNNFLSVDLGDMTSTTDSNGDAIYQVPTPGPAILPNNVWSDTNPVASPDGKTIDFISAQGNPANNTALYQVPTSTAKTKEIMKLKDNDLDLLLWR